MMKKLIIMILSISMLLSNITLVQAENAGNVEIAWNYNLIDDGSEILYEEFPMTSHKTIVENMGMDLIFQYLKNIKETDVVTVEIKDTSDDNIILDKTLTADDNIVYFGNVPNEKIYSITINENINGISKQYIRYIETKYIVAEFPANLTLGNTTLENNNGESFSRINIKKVGDNPINVIESSQLDTFYQGLDRDSYYELQMNASKDGVTRFYQGFISTYGNGEFDGVFTRGYELRENFINASTYSMRSVNTNYEVTDGYIYEQYRTEYDELTANGELLIRFIPPRSGSYTIETIGNLDTMIISYSVVNGEVDETSYSVDRDSGEGENGSIPCQFIVDDTNRPEKFIVVSLESGEGGHIGFRIVPGADVFNDDYVNNREIVKTNCDAGNYSAPTNEGYINYYGDVDVFGYNITEGTGYLMITAKITRVVQSVVYYLDPLTTEFDPWVKGTYASGTLHTIPFNNGRHYFEVAQPSSKMPEFSTDNDTYYESDSYSYTFNLAEPGLKDPIDTATHSVYGNDTPIYTTEITDFPYLSMDTLTLHKGDNDMFSFTTGNTYSDITVIVDQLTNDKYYIPHLYDAEAIEIYNTETPEWSVPIDLANYETNEGINTRLTYEGLLPNHEYIINITTENSSDYSSYHKYILEVILSESEVPAATLSGNVTLTHTIGENITSLDAFKNAIMENMTCTLDGVAVADSEALSDVVLYSGSNILTVENVNSLAAGSYTITPKYRGVAATGGTVTLTVSAPASDRIEAAGYSSASSLEWAATPEYDALISAKYLANTRRLKEGLSPTTISVDDAALALHNMTEDNAFRLTRTQTRNAVYYFYTNGASTSNTGEFTASTNPTVVSEDALYDIIASGNIVLMQLADSTATTDIEKMRYIIICGVDKSTHQLKIYDSYEYTLAKRLAWVSTSSIMDGGYVSTNTNVKFLGSIIIMSDN